MPSKESPNAQPTSDGVPVTRALALITAMSVYAVLAVMAAASALAAGSHSQFPALEQHTKLYGHETARLIMCQNPNDKICKQFSPVNRRCSLRLLLSCAQYCLWHASPFCHARCLPQCICERVTKLSWAVPSSERW